MVVAGFLILNGRAARSTNIGDTDCADDYVSLLEFAVHVFRRDRRQSPLQVHAFGGDAVVGDGNAVAEHVVFAAPMDIRRLVLDGDKAVESVVGVGCRAGSVGHRGHVAVFVVGHSRTRSLRVHYFSVLVQVVHLVCFLNGRAARSTRAVADGVVGEGLVRPVRIFHRRQLAVLVVPVSLLAEKRCRADAAPVGVVTVLERLRDLPVRATMLDGDDAPEFVVEV